MTESASGDKYYYNRGCVRLLAKMDEEALRAFKTVAIEQEKSIMEVAKEALENFLKNPEVLPKEFNPESNGSSLKTFIPRDLHKQVKIVSTRDFGKRLGDLTGAVLSRWAKERVSAKGQAFEAKATVEAEKADAEIECRTDSPCAVTFTENKS